METIRAAVRVVLTGILLIGLVGSGATSAQAATAEGVVMFDVTGSDSGSARVVVCPTEERPGPWTGEGCAAPTWVNGGKATVGGLPAGSYVAHIEPTQPHQTFFAEWWLGASSRSAATPFTVTTETTTVLDWPLREGASLTGTLRDRETGLPIGNTTVILEDLEGRHVSASSFFEDGVFTIHGVRSGSYVLSADTWGYSAGLVRVDLVEGEITERDLVLTRRGDVAGTITVAGNHDPHGTVQIVDAAGKVAREVQFGSTSTTSGAAGAFLAEGIEPGTYRVRFVSTDQKTYPTWLGGKPTSVGARAITVKAESMTVLGTQPMLTRSSLPTAQIAARVTGPDSELVDSLNADVYDRDGFIVAGGSTARGTVSFTLPAGTYRLHVADKPVPLPGYSFPWRYRYDAQWWGGTSLSTAREVIATAGLDARVEVRMKRTLPADSRAVGGRVTAGGLGMPGVRVALQSSPRPGGGSSTVTTVYTNDTGHYRARGLPPGTYQVYVQDDPRWEHALSAVPRLSPAVPIDLTRTPTATVDADLGTSMSRSTIRGRLITADTGTALAGVRVDVATRTEQPPSLTTDEGGWFEFQPWYEDATITLTVRDSGKYAGTSVTVSAVPDRMVAKVIALLPKLTATTPTLPKTAKVGVSVKTSVKGWTSGAKLTYQWKRNGTVIKGATKSTYTPVAADRGKKLTVSVTGNKSGYAKATRTSAAKVVAYGTIKAATPKITGTRKVGKTLTAVPGTGTTGVTRSYQWYANGKAITGATKRTYKLTWREGRDAVSVKITARKAGYKTVARTSARTGKVAW